MSKTKEGDLKEKVKELFVKHHVYPFTQALARIKAKLPIVGSYSMPSSNGYGEAGIGDFLVCLGGIYIEVETKAKDGKLRGIQQARRDVTLAAGGEHIVLYGDDDLYEFEKKLSVARDLILNEEGRI